MDRRGFLVAIGVLAISPVLPEPGPRMVTRTIGDDRWKYPTSIHTWEAELDNPDLYGPIIPSYPDRWINACRVPQRTTAIFPQS